MYNEFYIFNYHKIMYLYIYFSYLKKLFDENYFLGVNFNRHASNISREILESEYLLKLVAMRYYSGCVREIPAITALCVLAAGELTFMI